MSLPRRRLLLAIPLALAACGFEPVYGTGGSGNSLQNQILVEPPDTRDSYILVRELETRLGRPTVPVYALALQLAILEEGLAIDRDDNTTRFNYLGSAEYVMRDLTSGQIVTSGQVESFTGYSATDSTVATLAAERAAQRRLMVILADQIVNRLYAVDLGG